MRALQLGTLVAVSAIATSAPAIAAPAACPHNPNALGVSRTVEIDTTNGPGFGFEHYKTHDFLGPKEVVLTFDDGPQVNTTKAVVDALANHCTKAIFFSIGKMALGLPEIIRDVAKRGHTVGTHTWSHANLRAKKADQEAIEEIERGVSAVRRAVGAPIAPFFRYPTLQDSAPTLAHLGSRNIAIFSTDIDTFDFKLQTPANLVKSVMQKLDKHGKGILLLHDIQPRTAQAMPELLNELKAKGYQIVHIVAKSPVTTLSNYDALVEKDVKGLPAPGNDRPTSSVVRTIEGGSPAPAPAAAATPAVTPPVKK